MQRQRVIDIVWRLNKADYKTALAGALRRQREAPVGLIVTLARPEQVKEIFPRARIKHKTARLRIQGEYVYIRSATPETWGAALLFMTGPFQHKKCVCADARAQGLKLGLSGLWLKKERIAGRTERQIYETLGLKFVPARLRWCYRSQWRPKDEC